MNVTIFESIYEKKPFHIPVDAALARIKEGKSATRVNEVRSALDKGKADSLKKNLPAVAFAGQLAARGDKHLLRHSGFMILDFDKLEDVSEKMASVQAFPHTYAAWVSPSGNGIKALVKIADGTKHREHFQALRETFPDADPSGVNEERLCFESYDPHLYHNPKATPYTGIITVRQVTEKVDTYGDDAAKFQSLLKWISNKMGAFSTGSRNRFIFILAGACCRYGMDAQTAGAMIANEFPASSDFTHREMMTAVKSAYRTNAGSAGTVRFERDQVVNIKSRREVKISELPDFDPEAPPRDVIYAADVKAQALDIYDNGYASVSGIDVFEIDERWKLKRGEITCLTGIGNYGKSAFYKWYQLMRVLIYGERFASFSPEDNPPAEYYHDFVEMLLGCECTPYNSNRPSRAVYDRAYDWIGKHIFYLYPQSDAPTPDYIKARFLELVVKEKIDGCCIDPFNQLTNDYGARSDKYLESLFGDFARFAQTNNLYFVIVAHPKQMGKGADGNYPCPDVFDLADGAMWNNKMDNILTYHRPFGQSDPVSPNCELHSKKIRRQKTVGKRGFTEFRYVRTKRRFEVGLNDDPMGRAIVRRRLTFDTDTPPPIEHPKHQQSPENQIDDDFWNE